MQIETIVLQVAIVLLGLPVCCYMWLFSLLFVFTTQWLTRSLILIWLLSFSLFSPLSLLQIKRKIQRQRENSELGPYLPRDWDKSVPSDTISARARERERGGKEGRTDRQTCSCPPHTLSNKWNLPGRSLCLLKEVWLATVVLIKMECITLVWAQNAHWRIQHVYYGFFLVLLLPFPCNTLGFVNRVIDILTWVRLAWIFRYSCCSNKEQDSIFVKIQTHKKVQIKN